MQCCSAALGELRSAVFFVIFSDLCPCSAILLTLSVDHDFVSLLEHMVAGQQLVVEDSIVGAARPFLELFVVDWASGEAS